MLKEDDVCLVVESNGTRIRPGELVVYEAKDRIVNREQSCHVRNQKLSQWMYEKRLYKIGSIKFSRGQKFK